MWEVINLHIIVDVILFVFHKTAYKSRTAIFLEMQTATICCGGLEATLEQILKIIILCLL